jgi:hypothetical protein
VRSHSKGKEANRPTRVRALLLYSEGTLCLLRGLSSTFEDTLCPIDGVSDTFEDTLCPISELSSTFEGTLCPISELSSTFEDTLCPIDGVSDTFEGTLCPISELSSTFEDTLCSIDGVSGTFEGTLRPIKEKAVACIEVFSPKTKQGVSLAKQVFVGLASTLGHGRLELKVQAGIREGGSPPSPRLRAAGAFFKARAFILGRFVERQRLSVDSLLVLDTISLCKPSF